MMSEIYVTKLTFRWQPEEFFFFQDDGLPSQRPYWEQSLINWLHNKVDLKSHVLYELPINQYVPILFLFSFH